MKYFLIATLALALAGCGVFAPSVESAAGKVADGVTEYCEQTDENFRQGFREQVNRDAAPNSIRVDCAE